VDETKTSSPITLRRAACWLRSREVTAHRACTGHAPPAWDGQRPLGWANMLVSGPVGHCGVGLCCSSIEHCVVVIPLGLFQIESISNFSLN
jgi:hypothetical protein